MIYGLIIASAIFGNVWNFKLQFFFQLLISGYFFVFLAKSFKNGEIILPKNYLLALFVALVSLFSFLTSPVRAIISWEFVNFLCGLSVFLFSTEKKEEIKNSRNLLYFILAIVALSGFYQFFLGSQTYGTLKNSNTLATYSIIAAGFAATLGNIWLFAAFLALIVISKSVGAVLAILSASFFYAYERKGLSQFKENKFLSVAMLALLFFALFFVDYSSVSDRISWWKASFLMFLERPILGFGTGSFSYVKDAFNSSPGLNAVYAHNHYLEFLCENGIFSFFIYVFFLYKAVFSLEGLPRYAGFAVLIHSIFDFGLAVPYLNWFFMFFLGLFAKEEKTFLDKRFLRPFAVLMASVFAVFIFRGYKNVKIETALEKYSLLNDESFISTALKEYPSSYDLNLINSSILIKKSLESKEKNDLFDACVSAEKTLVLNPYLPKYYSFLGNVYNGLGEKDLFLELSLRRQRYIKWGN